MVLSSHAPAAAEDRVAESAVVGRDEMVEDKNVEAALLMVDEVDVQDCQGSEVRMGNTMTWLRLDVGCVSV